MSPYLCSCHKIVNFSTLQIDRTQAYVRKSANFFEIAPDSALSTLLPCSFKNFVRIARSILAAFVLYPGVKPEKRHVEEFYRIRAPLHAGR